MRRIVAPEKLDELPAADPRALGSRRDLQRLNWIMGHARLMCRALENTSPSPRRIVELGAGDGLFLFEVAKILSRKWPKVEVVLVDCKDAVADETRAGYASLGWNVEVVVADIFDWLKKDANEPVDLMTANLFLHQFPDTPLVEMLALAAARTKLFAACEPERDISPLVLSKLLWFIGCNSVTRHDAPASVRAGFDGKEISALWPKSGRWQLNEARANLFSHTFVAQRM